MKRPRRFGLRHCLKAQPPSSSTLLPSSPTPWRPVRLSIPPLPPPAPSSRRAPPRAAADHPLPTILLLLPSTSLEIAPHPLALSVSAPQCERCARTGAVSCAGGANARERGDSRGERACVPGESLTSYFYARPLPVPSPTVAPASSLPPLSVRPVRHEAAFSRRPRAGAGANPQ